MSWLCVGDCPLLSRLLTKQLIKKGKSFVYTTYCHRMGYLIVFVLPCLYINCFLSSRDQRGNELVVCWRLPSLVSTTFCNQMLIIPENLT